MIVVVEPPQISKREYPKRLVIVTNSIALISAGLAVILTYMGIFLFQSPLGLYRILPGDILVDFVWIWVIALLSGMIIYAISAFLLKRYLGLHRIFTGGSYNYYIQKRDSLEIQTSHAKRLITPALVSLGVSFSLTQVPDIVYSLFVVESFDSLPAPVAAPLLASMPLFFILLLIASFISIVFAPAWMLEDIGIICEKRSTGETADIMGVGNWYLTLLKGFGGITTLLAYVFISIDMIAWFQALPTYGVEVPIWFFLIPVVVVIASPLIALAPISVAYILYLTILSKSASALELNLREKGLKQVLVDIRSVE